MKQTFVRHLGSLLLFSLAATASAELGHGQTVEKMRLGYSGTGINSRR
jgi:hypothetical protein